MANQGKIVEGVFALNKPHSISSAQALRDLQTHFDPSTLFAPWLTRERSARAAESSRQHHRRSSAKRGAVRVKIGHGGTLDPAATGVLIAGVGRGTKELQRFLECTKSYEAVVLFGAATDTYDGEGKVVARKPYTHVTRKGVEGVLDRFRGKIMQRPPIYSALRIEGKRLYEYAREGKEVPVEIKERPVEVLELELVDWLPGGEHKYRWPEKEAGKEEKIVAEKLLQLNPESTLLVESSEERAADLKRKRGSEDGDDAVREASPETRRLRDESTKAFMSGALPPSSSNSTSNPSTETSPNTSHSTTSPNIDAGMPPTTSSSFGSNPPNPPAARLRMIVTSGFYVRSLCHDLGEAVGSLAIMSALVRTRQGEFTLGENVLEYDDLAKGEKVWGPKVEKMLDEWAKKDTVRARESQDRVSLREANVRSRNSSSEIEET